MFARSPSALLIFPAFLALAFASLAHSRDYWKVEQGASTMKILSMPTEPRQAALAGSGIASPRSAGEALRNPLAGASASIPSISFSRTNFSNAIGANRVSMLANATFEIFGSWHLSTGIEALNYDDIQGYTEDGLTSDGLLFSSGTVAAQLGAAKKFSSLTAGINARYATQNIDRYYEQGFLLDGGVSYELSENFAFGAVFNNLGWISSNSAEPSEKEIAPLSFQAGITANRVMPLGFAAAISADLFRRNDSEKEFRAGAELMYKELLALRFGMPFSADNENSALSAGIAVKISSITAEYAYQNRAVLEANHIFGIGIGF